MFPRDLKEYMCNTSTDIDSVFMAPCNLGDSTEPW